MSTEPQKPIDLTDEISDSTSERVDHITYKISALMKALDDKDNKSFESHIAHTTNHIQDKVIPKLSHQQASQILNQLFENVSQPCKSIKVHLRWAQQILKFHHVRLSEEPWVLDSLNLFISNSDTRVEMSNLLSKIESRFDLIFAQKSLQKNHELFARETNKRKRDLEKDQLMDASEEEEEEEEEEELYQTWNENDLLEEYDDSEYESLSDTAPDVKDKLKFRKTQEESDDEE